MLTVKCFSCDGSDLECRDSLPSETGEDGNSCYYSFFARELLKRYNETGKTPAMHLIAQYLAQRGDNIDSVLSALPKE